MSDITSARYIHLRPKAVAVYAGQRQLSSLLCCQAKHSGAPPASSNAPPIPKRNCASKGARGRRPNLSLKLASKRTVRAVCIAAHVGRWQVSRFEWTQRRASNGPLDIVCEGALAEPLPLTAVA